MAGLVSALAIGFAVDFTTGFAVDFTTGFAVDFTTGFAVDFTTGFAVDFMTGFAVDFTTGFGADFATRFATRAGVPAGFAIRCQAVFATGFRAGFAAVFAAGVRTRFAADALPVRDVLDDVGFVAAPVAPARCVAADFVGRLLRVFDADGLAVFAAGVRDLMLGMACSFESVRLHRKPR